MSDRETTDRFHPLLNKPQGPGKQNEVYLVLSDEERAKGFVRPVRRSYIHVGNNNTTGCGSVTTMSQAIAETYARQPGFYGSTFCVRCGAHFPVGAGGEFVWDDDQRSRVGT